MKSGVDVVIMMIVYGDEDLDTIMIYFFCVLVV
jgi:hypothetical protein